MSEPNMINPNAPKPRLTPEQEAEAKKAIAGVWAKIVERYPTLAPWTKFIGQVLLLIGGALVAVETYQTAVKTPSPPVVVAKDEEKPKPEPSPSPPAPTIDFSPMLAKMDAINANFGTLGGKIDAMVIKIDTKPAPKPSPPMPKPGDPTDPLTGNIPAEMTGKVGEPLYIKSTSTGKLRWIVPPDAPTFSREFGPELMLVPKVDGQFRIGLATIAGGEIAPVEWMLVKVGRAPMPPPEPEPEPKPKPEPKPPEPKPDGPFPTDGLRVLIVYESAKTLSVGQNSVIYGKKVRDYLREKCVKGPDGKTPEFRIYDQDLDVSGDSAVWQKAMARPRASVPWIVIGGRTSWHEGPLASGVTVEEVLALLKKHGGE